MSDRRPLVLVPSSKAKADGGDGPAYRDCLDDGVIGQLRSLVLDALVDAAASLDDAAVMRLCGVKPDGVAHAREQLAGLAKAATMPAHQRYTGVVHRFAALDAVDPGSAGIETATFTGLGGVVLGHEPVPDYRLEVTGRAGEVGVLGTWWRKRLEPVLAAMVDGRRVWDLLPGEFAKLLPKAALPAGEWIAVTFKRADGRMAPSASAKVGKGQLVQALLAEPDLDAVQLLEQQPLADWRFVAVDDGLHAVLH